MASKRVHVFELGYSADIDLKAASTLINSCQQEVWVDVLDGRHHIGDPDVHALAYPKETLFEQFPARAPGEVYVGVTVAPIEGDFSTVTQGVDSIVITLHRAQTVSAEAGRTKEEYVAQTLVTEWLWLQYRQATGDPDFGKLFHRRTRACIFNLVLDKSEKVHKLRRGHICKQCADKLDKANVASSLVSAVMKVLEGVQKPAA
ncbi:MAG: hypothetical protein QOI26_1054 [Pseudonocardiales bacterium]|nr:hypothetical protein [Pseudonocardiales bacterium]